MGGGGEGQEDVVEARPTDRDPLGGSPSRHQPTKGGVDMGDSAVRIDFERVPETVGPSLVEEVHRTLAGRAVCELEPKDLPAETRFQLSRAALGDNPSMVEHGDAVGELVSFFEVLRGQQDRDTVIRQPAGRVPQLLAARGSSPVVGSSKKSSCGFTIMLIARSSRRRMPPEYIPTRR